MTKKILLALVLGLTAASARADISDSGNLTIGGNGVIQGTMTVQGNSFSVGGVTFTVAGGSVTLGGRLNAAAAGIKWADGTTSTTASSGTSSSVLASSFSFLPSYSFTQTTFRVAAGTVTMTTGANPVLVCIGCSAGAYPAASSYCGISVLVDGGYVTGLGSGIGPSQIYGNNSGSVHQSACIKTQSLSAGSHSFALVGAAFGGAGCYCDGGSGSKHSYIGAYELSQ